MKTAFLSLFTIGVLLAGCTDNSHLKATTVTTETIHATPSIQEPSNGYWQLDSETNPVTGVVTNTAYLKFQGAKNIYVRQIGKKLECYINTDDFLETTSNLDTRASVVQYRFDSGKVIHQTWTISDDNEALFYPGNPKAFLAAMSHAKSLAFEYRPAEKVPETVSFDVTGFPSTFSK